MKFSKATKFDTWLKFGIAGLPGAGKTYTALNIAKYMSTKRVALIDSEAGTASKYANIFDFDSNDLTVDDDGKEVKRPFDPRRYVEAIKEAIASGDYDVLVIDGLTPEWDDQGGILQMVDELQRIKKMNTRDSWSVATPLHNELMNLIIRSKIHIICTMLAKKETVVEKDAHGRTIGKKIAMDPIQRDNVPRLFDVFGIMQDKEMIIDKTRCPEIDGQAFMKPGKDLADILIEWVKGDPIPERTIEPVQATTPAPHPQSSQQIDPAQERPYLGVFNAGKKKGLWAKFEGFCKFATAELGEEVNRDNVLSLTSEQLAALDIAISEEEPVKQAS